MTSRWFLRIALAMPVLLLLGVGLRTWRLEGVQEQLDYQSSVRQLVLGIAARLERFATGEPWPGERLAGSAAKPLVGRSPNREQEDQLLVLSARYERAAAVGEQQAAQWLQQQGDGGSPRLTAWLDLRRARIAKNSGELDIARAAWRRVADTDAGRDERGLRLDLLARALLLFEQPEAQQAELLAVALTQDQLDDTDLATAVLRTRVITTHMECANDAAQHQEFLHRLQPHLDALNWRSLRTTLDREAFPTPRLARISSHGDWLIAGRELSAPGPEEAAAERVATLTEVRGITLQQAWLGLFPPTTRQLAIELGIRIDLLDQSGTQWLSSHGIVPQPVAPQPVDPQPVAPQSGSPLPAAATLHREDLPTGLGSVAATQDQQNPNATRRNQRRTGWLLAIALAVMTACVAGWFGLRALKKQEQLTKQRAGFVAAVSHELKTPLTATRLLGELLERGDLDEAKVREFGGRIARESERLDQLVRNVLDLARVERIGLEAGSTAVVYAAEFVDEAIARHRETVPDAQSPPVQFVARGPQDLCVTADREALLGAFANLLENACRHAPESPSIEVTIAAIAHDRRVRFEVRDRGPGVSPSDRKRIFGEFERGGDEDTRKTKGTGIGLSLVARIAAAHGGSACCEPRPDGEHGAVFVIELPATAATPAAMTNPLTQP